MVGLPYEIRSHIVAIRLIFDLGASCLPRTFSSAVSGYLTDHIAMLVAYWLTIKHYKKTRQRHVSQQVDTRTPA